MNTQQDDYAMRRRDLVQSIEHGENQVRLALHDLSDAAGLKLDFGSQIRTSPMAWTIGAFLIGAWLGDRAPAANAAGTRSPR